MVAGELQGWLLFPCIPQLNALQHLFWQHVWNQGRDIVRLFRCVHASVGAATVTHQQVTAVTSLTLICDHILEQGGGS